MAEDVNLLKVKSLQCHNCNMRLFWSMARDRYAHTTTGSEYCALPDLVAAAVAVAHPRIKD